MKNFSLLKYTKTENYIKDPIHKEINFKKNKLISELVNTKEFLRLRNIKQLGLSFKIFPSATHNRYTHSIGTYQVASKFVNAFSDKIDDKQKKIFLVSALLHDIGHGPYSHVFEKIVYIKHEEMTKNIILNPKSDINKVLIKNNVDPLEIINVIDGKSKYKWMNKLISSNIDVDRIDYMLRDSYYIGTHYSTIDIDFLIERTYFKKGDIFFSTKTKNVIESFLLGRYYMHSDIYENKNTYIYEWAITSIFKRLREIPDLFHKNSEKIYFYDLYSDLISNDEKYTIDIDKYSQYNDENFSSFLKSLVCIDDAILNSFIDGFFNETGIIALNYFYKNDVINEIKKSNKDIDMSYIYCEIERKNKSIFSNDKKNQIDLIDIYAKKVFKFNSSKLVNFKSNKNIGKIILVNKNILI